MRGTIAGGLLLALVASGCAAAAAPCGGTLPTTEVTLVDAARREHRLTVEVADTDDERARGLAGRRDLPPACGMLFEYPEPVRNPFWMRGMAFPLDIAFVDASGTIIEVVSLPPCGDGACPATVPRQAYTRALEVNAGVLERLKIGAGDRLVVPRQR